MILVHDSKEKIACGDLKRKKSTEALEKSMS